MQDDCDAKVSFGSGFLSAAAVVVAFGVCVVVLPNGIVWAAFVGSIMLAKRECAGWRRKLETQRT